MATAAVRAAYRDDYRAATHPTESVVRGKEGSRDRFPECRAALFEREGKSVNQSVFFGELIVDRGEIR